MAKRASSPLTLYFSPVCHVRCRAKSLQSTEKCTPTFNLKEFHRETPQPPRKDTLISLRIIQNLNTKKFSHTKMYLYIFYSRIFLPHNGGKNYDFMLMCDYYICAHVLAARPQRALPKGKTFFLITRKN